MNQPFPVYVVHEPGLADRREALDASLARLGWTAEWIVDPSIGIGSYASRRISPRLSRAQASVYAKQIEAFRRIAAAPAPRALILEDDPVFPDDFRATFDRYLAAMPADAESVFFGASCGLEADPAPSHPLFARVDRTRSMSVYVVTRPWAAAMHAALAPAPMRLPIDLAVDTVIRRTSSPTYWSVPALVANGSESGQFPGAVTKGRWRSHPIVRWLART